MFDRVADLLAVIHPHLRDLARRAKIEVPGPADDAQLEAVQRKWGGPLPPSYREFLRLQNGWPRLGHARIASTAELLAENACDFAVDCANRRHEYFKSRHVDPHDSAACAAYQPTAGDGDVVPWHQWVFALGADGDVWFFDTRHRSPNGELPVAHYRPTDGVCGQWPSFQAWLEAVLTARP